MRDAPFIAFALFCFVFLLIGSVIGGMILRAAVSLFNKMAGLDNTADVVPEPPLGTAMGITFVTAVVNGIVGFLIGLATGTTAAAMNVRGEGVTLTAQLISFPVGLIVMAGMLVAILPTTVKRALGVMLCHFLIAVAIGMPMMLIAYLVFR